MQTSIKALTFDVFGTVVDWKGTIIADGRKITQGRFPNMDWGRFADAWMHGYGTSVANMKEWTNLDTMLAAVFESLLPTFGLESLSELERIVFSRAWSHLDPWPDAVAGFAALTGKVTLAVLTNANIAMINSLVTSTGLPWDMSLSAQHVRRYKPDPLIYKLAITALDLPAAQIMMVASHTFDLNAAHKAGMKTALIARKGEPGSDPGGLDHTPEIITTDLIDFVAQFVNLDAKSN